VPHPKRDSELVQIVDAALADATRRSGHWLVCKPGCTQCCVGVFAISPLDASRLKEGLRELDRSDPERAERMRARAHESAAHLSHDFPGDLTTGILFEDQASAERFEDFGNDEVCPALDPSTGLCDLYSARPITCRAFGPPVRTEGGLGHCELCFQGASEAQIAAGEMEVDPENLEAEIMSSNEVTGITPGQTIVTLALVTTPKSQP
jgi:Fe-S-cluster containining protein